MKAGKVDRSTSRAEEEEEEEEGEEEEGRHLVTQLLPLPSELPSAP